MKKLEPPTNLARRGLLASGASALAAAGIGREALAQAPAAPAAPARPALPAYVAWKEAEHMIVHTGNTIETRRGAFGTSVITPTDRLFIRNNLPPPDLSVVADRDA